MSARLAQSVNAGAAPEFKAMGAAEVSRRATEREMNLGEQRVGDLLPQPTLGNLGLAFVRRASGVSL